MRVRALHELCDWLGLAFVPGRMWESLDEHGDPSEAVTHFARSVGCDPDAIRRREHDALERLRTSVDLLFVLDQLDRLAGLGQKEDIESLLFGGDYALIERYHGIFTDLHHILIGSLKVRDRADLIAAYRRFIDMIEQQLARPLDLSWEKVGEQVAGSDRWVDAIERYARLHDDMERAIEVVLAEWPPGLDGSDDEAERDGIIGYFEETEDKLAGDSDLDLESVETLVGDCQRFRDDLWQMFEKVSGEGPRADDDDSGPVSEVEQALAFFGFATDARPTLPEVRSAWRDLVRENHSDRVEDRTDEEAIRKCDTMVADANVYRAVLQEHLKTLDAMA